MTEEGRGREGIRQKGGGGEKEREEKRSREKRVCGRGREGTDGGKKERKERAREGGKIHEVTLSGREVLSY